MKKPEVDELANNIGQQARPALRKLINVLNNECKKLTLDLTEQLPHVKPDEIFLTTIGCLLSMMVANATIGLKNTEIIPDYQWFIDSFCDSVKSIIANEILSTHDRNAGMLN